MASVDSSASIAAGAPSHGCRGCSRTRAGVHAYDRTATAGVPDVARASASAISPTFAGMALAAAAFGVPFFVAGGLKILYDGLVYLTFRNVHPPEEIERRKRSRDA